MNRVVECDQMSAAQLCKDLNQSKAETSLIIPHTVSTQQIATKPSGQRK